MLSKSTIVDTISWDQLLKILEDEIELRDKVTKL